MLFELLPANTECYIIASCRNRILLWLFPAETGFYYGCFLQRLNTLFTIRLCLAQGLYNQEIMSIIRASKAATASLSVKGGDSNTEAPPQRAQVIVTQKYRKLTSATSRTSNERSHTWEVRRSCCFDCVTMAASCFSKDCKLKFCFRCTLYEAISGHHCTSRVNVRMHRYLLVGGQFIGKSSHLGAQLHVTKSENIEPTRNA